MRLKKNHPYVFQIIAPIYGWFYNIQKKGFIKKIELIKQHDILSDVKTVLDVGCGTGALSYVLASNGYNVRGIDPIKGMLKIAKKKAKELKIDYREGNILNGLDIKDKSFDVTVASYVAHGLKKPDRLKMYEEMKRVTKSKILFFEYNQKRNFLINVIEFFEGGDYFNYIKDVKQELDDTFKNVKILPLNNHGALYICELE